jgi:Cof subfamily protein (haloacid dehalogenase superfamily)
MVTAAVSDPAIRLLISDVDGTLLTSQKVLTERSRHAVDELRESDILFAITSSRPPHGITMLVDPLHLTTPLSAFNGGLITDSSLGVIQEKTIGEPLIQPVIELLRAHDLSIWVYRNLEWLVLDLDGPHVRHEAAAIHFEPTMIATFDDEATGIAKMVGVSDDGDAVAAAREALDEVFGHDVSATSSQTYYLDVTHPDANKGKVVDFLSVLYEIPTEAIATIGDMHNDVAMFTRSGLSIAMGNGPHDVQLAASVRTTTNDDEGFAHAVEHFILHR